MGVRHMVSLEWINLRFPNGFVHPFVFRGRDGREHERLLATVPKGVIVDGMDVGGYSLSVFATRWAKEQKADGRPVSIGLRASRPVELFRGRGRSRHIIRLAGPGPLRDALDRRRDGIRARDDTSSARSEGTPRAGDPGPRDPCAPAEPVRGNLEDAAPPAKGPAGGSGMDLFNHLAYDNGFVSRMDCLVTQFARDFVHHGYDPHAALDEVRGLVSAGVSLLESSTGDTYDGEAVDCAATLALSAVTSAINGCIGVFVDRGEGDPRIVVANIQERRARMDDYFAERAMMSEDMRLRTTYTIGPPSTTRCLHAFVTTCGAVDGTDLFGDLDPAPTLNAGTSMPALTR